MVFFKKTPLWIFCEIDFCRPALKSHQNVIHSPVKIDSAPSISSFQLSYWSLQLLTHLNDREFSK